MIALAKGVFETPSSGSVQSVRGIPFAPKAVVAWWSQQEQFGVGSGNRGGIGFWSESGSGAVAWASSDGASTTTATTIAEPIGLLGLDRPGSRPSMRAELSRLEDDGFTVRWLDLPEKKWIVHYLAIGGSVAADVGWTVVPNTPGNQGLALAAHDEQVVFFTPTGVSPAGHGGLGLTLGFGVAGPAGQAATAYGACAGSAPGAVTGAQSTSEGVLIAHNALALAAAGRVGQQGGGTTIDWSIAGPTAGRVCYLALRGIRAVVGSDLSPTRPGAKRTKVGFEPEGLLLFSWGLGPSDVPKNIGRLCIGGASPEASGCASWDDRNTATPLTGAHVHSSAANVLIVTDTQTGEIHAAAALQSLDRRGFTLDWTASDGKEREFVYVALASSSAARRGSLFSKH